MSESKWNVFNKFTWGRPTSKRPKTKGASNVLLFRFVLKADRCIIPSDQPHSTKNRPSSTVRVWTSHSRKGVNSSTVAYSKLQWWTGTHYTRDLEPVLLNGNLSESLIPAVIFVQSWSKMSCDCFMLWKGSFGQANLDMWTSFLTHSAVVAEKWADVKPGACFR